MEMTEKEFCDLIAGLETDELKKNGYSLKYYSTDRVSHHADIRWRRPSRPESRASYEGSVTVELLPDRWDWDVWQGGNRIGGGVYSDIPAILAKLCK